MFPLWCGRRDLNPGYRLGRPVSWTRLDYGRPLSIELFLWGVGKSFSESFNSEISSYVWVVVWLGLGLESS